MEESVHSEMIGRKGGPLLSFVTSHQNLAFFYGIFLFLYELQFLRQLIPVIHPVLIGWAGLLFLYDLFCRKLWKALPFWQPLALFAVSAGLTALLTRDAGLVGNIKTYILTILPLCAFYPLCFLVPRQARLKTFLNAFLGAAVIVFLSSLIAIGTFLLHFSRQFTFMGFTKTVGTLHYFPNDPTSALLTYGIYQDTNHAAIYAIISFFYGLMLLFFCRRSGYSRPWQNKLGKVFAIFNCVVQFLYFPLADSRGGYLSLAAALLVCGTLYFFTARLKNKKGAAKAALSFLLAVAVTLAAFAALLASRATLTFVSEVLEGGVFSFHHDAVYDPSTFDSPSFEDELIADSFTFTKADRMFGGGRLIIWADAMQLFRHNPIMGESPGNGPYFSQQYSLNGTLALGTAVHNSYLDLLLDYGIIGAVLLLSFWVLCAVAVLKFLLPDRRQADFPFYCSMAAVVVIACGVFFLSSVFINTTAMYISLLLFTSYLISEAKSAPVPENS